MALANIRLQQPPSADAPPGTSRRNLVAGVPVVLRNGDDAQVSSWRWVLLYKPPSSSAVILNPNSAVATITPDVRGHSYRLRLSINGGRLSHGEVQTIVFRVPDGSGFAAPAVGERGSESNYIINGNPNTAAWADEFVRRYLHQYNNLDALASHVIANGANYTFEVPWTLSYAVLKYLFIRTAVSTDISVRVFSDAAMATEIALSGVSLANLDATGNYILSQHHTLGVLGEGKLYINVRNNGVNSNVSLGVWLGAL